MGAFHPDQGVRIPGLPHAFPRWLLRRHCRPTAEIPGWMVVLVWVGVSIALLGGGIWLWRRRRDKLIGTALRSLQAMLVLGAFVLAGMLLSLLGAWLPAGLLLLATIILVTAMLAYFLTIS